jgi:hypothetical protein
MWFAAALLLVPPGACFDDLGTSSYLQLHRGKVVDLPVKLFRTDKAYGHGPA